MRGMMILGICLLLTVLLCAFPAIAEEHNGIEYQPMEGKSIQVKDDFSVHAVMARKSAKSPLDSSIQFYSNGSDTYYNLAVRWLKANRCDIYLEKYVDGQYLGYMIAEEFQLAQKTGLVSTDFGWDVSSEADMVLDLTLRSGIATVTLTGKVTGICETLHFDLAKSPKHSHKTTETNPARLTSGQLSYTIRGGSFSSFTVDKDTLSGKKASLPEDPWVKARKENRHVNTPLGSLAVGDFTAGYYQHEGTSLPYQIYLPDNYEEGKTYPVMLYLHGAGQLGTDNEQQITAQDFTLCHRIIQEKRECIIIAPQTNEYWVQYDQDRSGNIRRPRGLMVFEEAQESGSLKAALAMIAELKEKNFVDPERVYVSGYSMGGHGTWYLIAAYPETFAAAVVSCGAGSIEMADTIAKTPVYVFHGDLDNLVSFSAAQVLTEAVQEAGGDAHFIAATCFDHGIFIPMRMDENVVNWLFSHSKAQNAAAEAAPAPQEQPTAAAEPKAETNAEAKKTAAVTVIEYLPVEDKEITLKDEFSLRAVLQRKNAKSPLQASIQFYSDGNGNYYSLALQWLKASRLDCALEKYTNGEYIGAMLPVEYESTKKVNYVSTNDGWDLSLDTELEVVLTAQAGYITVTLTGNETGIGKTLHFDLSKSAYHTKYTENPPAQLTKGQLTQTIRGGSFTYLGVDSATWKGEKAMLPENPWIRAHVESLTAKTPFGTFNVGDYTAGSYTYGNTTIPYQIYLPANYDAGKEYPVYIHLHGAGLRGNDNEQVITSGEYVLGSKMIAENRECIIVAPQSPIYWVQYDPDRSGNIIRPRGLMRFTEAQESDYLKAVLAMIGEMKKTDFVDESRVYIGGYSMGAHAGWYLLAAYPDDFAAAILSCGVGSIEKADEIAKTPIYVFHGDKDDLVSFEAGKKLTEAVQAAGGDATFIHAKGYDHGISVPMKADANVLDWLFSKSKAQAAEETAAPAAGDNQPEAAAIEYRQLADQEISLNGDFSVRAVFERKSNRSALDGSIQFYHDGTAYYSLVLRWLKPETCEIYLEKYANKQYLGYMIAEEFAGIQKNTYPTTYQGWDVTTEKDLEVVLTVQDGIACVKLSGAVTGLSESLHFDLAKSPQLNKKDVEASPERLTNGLLKYTIRSGSFTFIGIDQNTFDGKKANLPKDEWIKIKEENRRADTPLGSLIIGDFTAGKYIHNGTVLPYQIYLPKSYEAGKEYPVMLFLHGRDMWGTDNQKPYTSGDFTIGHMIIRENRECIIIVPQSDDYWITNSAIRSGQPLTYPRRMFAYDDIQESVYMQATAALIHEVQAMDFADETRMYVSGYSMGGHGTWYMLAAYPDTFAAGVIFCGVGSIEKAADIAKTPIYVYHGTQDTLVSYSDSKRLADAVQAAGGDVTFITATEYGHGLFVPTRMDENVLDWLFSKSKEQP